MGGSAAEARRAAARAWRCMGRFPSDVRACGTPLAEKRSKSKQEVCSLEEE
jgi:hypothetical protein